MRVYVEPLTYTDLEGALVTVESHLERDLYRARAAMPGENYALWRGPYLLGIGGMTRRDEPGVGEAWVLLTPDGRRYPYTTYRYLCGILVELIEQMEITRVQALVRHDLNDAHRLARHLGFVLERPSHQIGKDGRPYDLYSGERKGESNGR